MRRHIAIGVVAASVLGFGSAESAENAHPYLPAAERTTIVVGHISGNAQKTFPRLEAMARFLAGRLTSVGVTGGGAVVARNNEEMLEYLRRGQVDVLSETVFSALSLKAWGAADILLVEEKRGVAVYRSVFFTRMNGGITRLRDLIGKKIGFEDRGSTTGYQLPRLILEAEGLEPEELATPESAVPTGKVGYRFLRQEINIAAAVASGSVDAGAFSSRDWDRPGRIPDRIKENLTLFHLSDPVPRSLLLVRRGLRAEIREKLRETLLAGPSTPDDEQAFRRYYRVTGYRVVDDAVAAHLDRLSARRQGARGLISR